jgi:hypothetical protein
MMVTAQYCVRMHQKVMLFAAYVVLLTSSMAGTKSRRWHTKRVLAHTQCVQL